MACPINVAQYTIAQTLGGQDAQFNVYQIMNTGVFVGALFFGPELIKYSILNSKSSNVISGPVPKGLSPAGDETISVSADFTSAPGAFPTSNDIVFSLSSSLSSSVPKKVSYNDFTASGLPATYGKYCCPSNSKEGYSHDLGIFTGIIGEDCKHHSHPSALRNSFIAEKANKERSLMPLLMIVAMVIFVFVMLDFEK